MPDVSHQCLVVYKVLKIYMQLYVNTSTALYMLCLFYLKTRILKIQYVSWAAVWEATNKRVDMQTARCKSLVPRGL